MPNHDVIGEDPDARRLEILTDAWPQICAWVQAGVTRRNPPVLPGFPFNPSNIGVLSGVINAIRALEAAGWLPAGTAQVADHEPIPPNDAGGLWQLMNASSDGGITDQQYQTFKSQVQGLNLTRRI